MSRKPLVLVDGSFYIYRSFFALPPLSTKDGQPTGAIKGALNALNKLLKQYLDKGTKVNVVNTDFNNQMTATAYSIQ